MSQKDEIQTLAPIIRANKNFVYKGKKFPIDFSLIKKNSNYFYSKRFQYKLIHDIELEEQPIEISDDSLRNFISSCQNESFHINDSNIYQLHQLSIKYEVLNLFTLTDQYIKNHDKSLIFQSIQYKIQLQNQNSLNDQERSILSSLSKDEESIANDFFNFINNEQLIDLPVPVLYRILNRPNLDLNKLNSTQKDQIIQFLFKCLNKHKREASVLFLNLDLENQRINLFSKLINEYSDVFDFSMINHKFLLKTSTDLLSEMSKLRNDFTNSIQQMNNLMNQMKLEMKKQNKTIDSFKQFAQSKLNKEGEKLEKSFNEFRSNLEEKNKNDREEAAKNVNVMKQLVDQNNNQIGSFVTKSIFNNFFFNQISIRLVLFGFIQFLIGFEKIVLCDFY